MNRTALVVGLASACLCGGSVRGQDVPGAVVDRVVEAYGGWQRLQRVAGYSMEGSLLTGHDKAAPTSRVFVRPGRLRVVIEHADGREVRVVADAKGWRTSPSGTTAAAEGPLLDSMTLQAARAALPWILAERRDEVTFASALSAEDKAPSGLQLVVGEGLTLRAYLDPQSHRITRALTVLQRGMTIAFEARFADFREVDGVLFPFREENYAGGRHTASTAFTVVRVNPPLDDAVFRQPGQP